MRAPWTCRLFHSRITRPVKGQYECLECLKKYDVDWDEGPATIKTETKLKLEEKEA